jgi:type I restriction enzyme S subunit
VSRIANHKLPVGWTGAVLGSLGSVGSSKRVHQRDWKSEGIPFFRAREIAKLSKNGTVENDLFITRDLFRELSKEGLVPTPGDVMITGVGTIGVPYIVKENDQFYFKDASVLIFKNDKGLDPRYLFFYIKSNYCQQWIIDGSTGTTVDTLTIARARNIPVPLAPLPEQKRIADKLEAVLGRVDACRTRLDRVPALLKRFRQSVLAAATSGKLTEEWRAENGVNYALENVEIEFEDASLTLPSSWKVTRADAVCSSVRDGTHDTPKYVKSGIPLVTSKNIRPIGIDFEGAQQISHDDHREISKRSKVDVGDVLFSMIGSVGHICIVETSREFSIKNVGLFKNNPGTVLPRYMFYWLQGPLFGQWLEPRLRGGNQKFASLGLLRESPVFLPPIPEQQEIVRRVEALFALADRIEARLAAAQATVVRLTPATLAKAFRGELVPQDPDDEPAAVLLERIAALKDVAPAKKVRAKRPPRA